jgi:hypothetical protein
MILFDKAVRNQYYYQINPFIEDPGGKETCVANFIDTQLTKNYVRSQHRYRKGLTASEKTCEQVMDLSFEKLNDDRQIRFLEMMEACM